MSAWYVCACRGFYPVNPSGGESVLGVPQAPGVALALPGGRSFHISAVGLSERNRYVKSVRLNGKPLTGFILRYADVLAGGELVFTMSDRP